MIRHSKPNLTIFADASILKTTAGWGGWARGDNRESILLSGPATHSKSSVIVELEALAEFIDVLKSSGYMRDTDTAVLLQSDSLGALQQLNHQLGNSWATKKPTGAKILRPRRPPPPENMIFTTRIREALQHCDVVYLRHVYGHQGGKTSRSWVNEQCDQLAKQAARAQTPATT